MTLWEVQQMVKDGETERIEFKTKANHPEKIIKEIVAFANTKGGRLLIGVSDTGQITGLRSAEEEFFTLEKAIRKYCFPKISYQSEIIPISRKKAIIIYTIFESERKPHYQLLDSRRRKRKGYIRVADRSVQASREMREILKRERRKAAVQFTYGDNEQLLMKYLDQNDFITLKNFAKIAEIKTTHASRTLVTLVLANVLQIIPREGEDIYRFNSGTNGNF